MTQSIQENSQHMIMQFRQCQHNDAGLLTIEYSKSMMVIRTTFMTAHVLLYIHATLLFYNT